MTPSILLPSDKTIITLRLDTVYTVFTLMLSFYGVLGFEFSVLILFSYLCLGLQIRCRNNFYEHLLDFWMIDQNSISVVVQGSIFFGVCG